MLSIKNSNRCDETLLVVWDRQRAGMGITSRFGKVMGENKTWLNLGAETGMGMNHCEGWDREKSFPLVSLHVRSGRQLSQWRHTRGRLQRWRIHPTESESATMDFVLTPLGT